VVKLDYILTHSGRKVSVASGVPSEEDIALSLSRQPRFGGMARRHWTVLDHSLFAAQLALHEFESPEIVLGLLLHDAHEWTGDIPTHFKTEHQRTLQRVVLDDRIFGSYFPGGWKYEEGMGLAFDTKIAEYDKRSLLAEALLVGPPCIKTSEDVELHFGARPRLKDLASLVIRLRHHRLGVDPNELNLGLQAGNVMDWLKSVRALRAQIEDRPPQHVCGLEGFDPMHGDDCPACVAAPKNGYGTLLPPGACLNEIQGGNSDATGIQ
jgi:hypothetical protein